MRSDDGISRPDGRAGRRPRRPVRRLVVCVLVAGVIAFAGGFGLFADHVSHMAAPGEPEAADGIVVLTGGQARIRAAVDLLKAGKGKRLLISGVNPLARADDLRLATGGDLDLFTCCVDIDHVALDTVGNAQESVKWIADNAYGSVIVVTNNYHMPRSMLEMRRQLDRVDLYPYPVVTTRLDEGVWLTKPDALRVLFIEYVKYVAALARSTVSRGGPAGQSAPIHAASDDARN